MNYIQLFLDETGIEKYQEFKIEGNGNSIFRVNINYQLEYQADKRNWRVVYDNTLTSLLTGEIKIMGAG